MDVVKSILYSQSDDGPDGHLKQTHCIIDRLVASGLPYHIAVHRIDIRTNPEPYCAPHAHSDEDELNIIINDQDRELSYRFTIDDEDFIYHAPASIWIPKNKMHAANALTGKGLFICIRFPENGTCQEG